jgi:hypothetical protein
MSVSSVLIGLQASHKDGRGVTASAFLQPLNIDSTEVEYTHADGGEWAAGMVCFRIVRFSAFSHVDNSVDAGAQFEAFFQGITDAFVAVGRFLDQRPAAVTDHLRSIGLSLQLFVSVYMDQDQMELDFPYQFLAACGSHKLKICLISNDISAADLIAS